VVKGLVGFTVGLVAGFTVGIVIFRLVADPSDEWADLTSIAGSVFTFAPVGSLIGLALGLRKRPWPWARMIIAGLLIGAIPVLFVRDSMVTAWGLGAYGMLVGGFAAWRVDRHGATRSQPG
jgi:hypothetical protein